jgi:hypothetical protein
MPGTTPNEDKGMDEFLADTLKQQTEALYPHLFLGPWAHRSGVLDYQLRRSSQLVAVAVRHDALTASQVRAIGEFRLQQYLLYRLYEAAKIRAHHVTTDPSIGDLPGETIHVLVGTTQGRILAYLSLETTVRRRALRGRLRSAHAARRAHRGWFLHEPGRPHFPCEIELFGPRVFPSVPALQSTPLSHMREMTRMLRNYVTRSPLGVAASIQTMLTSAHLLLRRDLSIDVALGCVDKEGRWLAAQMGMPIIFAPAAPVVVTPSDDPRTAYWSMQANSQGQFWPFVISVQDLRRRRAHLHTIDRALSLPASEMRHALVELRRAAHTLSLPGIMPAPNSSPVLWTADAGYRSGRGVRVCGEPVQASVRAASE